jgi:hypothetical protein
MKIILLEFGYDNEIEAEAFKSKDSLKDYIVNEIKFLDEEQFKNLWENSYFERSWGVARIYKNYEVL